MAQDQGKMQAPSLNMDEQMLYNINSAVNDEQAQLKGQLESSDAIDQALGRLDSYSDKATGEMRPFFADGTSAATPINESPISAEDRLRLSVGNKRGSLNYLQQKYEDASLDPKGNIVVKDQGLWKRVDAEGWGDGDAWSKTKEVLKDVLDITPEAATVAATLPIVGTGVGAIAASGAVTGAAGGARMLLGKMAGTFEAEPEEVMTDLGVEILLGLGGAAVAAGVKPGFDVIKKGLGGLGNTFNAMPDSVRKAYASVAGTMTGAGAENVDRAFTRGSQIADNIKAFTKGASSAEAAVQTARETQLNLTTQLLPQVRAGLTEMYENGIQKVAGAVPENVRFNPRDFVDEVSRSLQSSGLIQKGKQGFLELPKNPLDFAQIAKRSLDSDLVNLADEIAVDPSIYRALKKSVEGVVNVPSKTTSGGKGLLATNEVKKQVENLLRAGTDAMAKGRKTAPEAAANFLNKIKGDTSTAMTNYVKRVAGDDAGLQFAKMSEDYAKASNALRPALNAFDKAIKNRSDESAQAFIEKYLNNQDLTSKSAVKSAISLLKNTSKGKVIRALDDQIMDAEAAKAFIPVMRNNFFQFGAPIGVATGVASGNPLVAATFAATGGLTSPRLAFKGAQALTKFSSLPPAIKQVGVKTAWQVKDLISNAAKNRGIQKMTSSDLRLLTQSLGQVVGVEMEE